MIPRHSRMSRSAYTDSWKGDETDEDYLDPSTFDERLVEEIRKYPELYDDKHPDYHDLAKKHSLWKDVGLIMDSKVADCKKRWRSLRDNYRRFQKNPEKYGLSGRKETLFSLLSFLENVEVRRVGERYRFHGLLSANRPAKRSKTNATSNTPVIVRYGSQEDSPIKTEVASSTDEATSEAPPQKPLPIQYFVLKPDCVKTPLDQLQPAAPHQQDDEIDSFLRLMSQTIKKFSPIFQIEAKKKIFDVITEIEMRNCVESSRVIRPEALEDAPRPRIESAASAT